MKTTETPRDLFFDQLHDIYSMETQLGESFPMLATMVQHQGLRQLLLHHANETDVQRAEILKIFQRYGVPVGNDKSKAIAGLIEGGDAHLKSVEDPRTRDLMMIAHCLRIAHYEMAAYEITTRLAERLELKTEAAILGTLLMQEERIAEILMELEPAIFNLSHAAS